MTDGSRIRLRTVRRWQGWAAVLFAAPLLAALAGCTVVFESTSNDAPAAVESPVASRKPTASRENPLAEVIPSRANEPATVQGNQEADNDEPADVRLQKHAQSLRNGLVVETSPRSGKSTGKSTDESPDESSGEPGGDVFARIAMARKQGLLNAAAEAELLRNATEVPPEFRSVLVDTVLAMKRRERNAVAVDAPVASPARLGPKINTKLDAVEPWRNPPRELTAQRPEPRPSTADDAPEPGTPAPRRHDRQVVPASATTLLDKPAVPPGKNPSTLNAAAASLAASAHDDKPPAESTVMLTAAIRSLEEQLAAANPPEKSPQRQRKEAELRLLYMLAGRRDDALSPIADSEPAVREFWREWIFGTDTLLDGEHAPSDVQRASVAVHKLRQALDHLGKQANLELHNLAFCRRVLSFGVYEPMTEAGDAAAAKSGTKSAATAPVGRRGASGEAKYIFQPNQEVLLYAEVRNFCSTATDRGFHTVLRPSYQIFDASGRRIGSVVELDESHDYCRQQRADFFVRYHLYLPSRIDPGLYKLKLTVEDVHGQKVAENTIDFTIGPAP